MPTESKTSQHKQNRILMTVTILRAVLATLLGLALIISPDKVRPVLINFMGMFWLMSGLMGLRWGMRGEHPGRIPIITGAIGILVGGLVLLRNLVSSVFSDLVVIILLGSVILLTGLIHCFEGIPDVREGRRERSWISLIVGIFEVVLGGILIYSPLDYGPGVYWSAAIWSLAGGVLLFHQFLLIWRLSRAGSDSLKNDEMIRSDGAQREDQDIPPGGLQI